VRPRGSVRVYIHYTHRDDNVDDSFEDIDDRGEYGVNPTTNGRDNGTLRYVMGMEHKGESVDYTPL